MSPTNLLLARAALVFENQTAAIRMDQFHRTVDFDELARFRRLYQLPVPDAALRERLAHRVERAVGRGRPDQVDKLLSNSLAFRIAVIDLATAVPLRDLSAVEIPLDDRKLRHVDNAHFRAHLTLAVAHRLLHTQPVGNIDKRHDDAVDLVVHSAIGTEADEIPVALVAADLAFDRRQ